MAKTIDKVGDARPYLERALSDEDLRDNVKSAFTAARDAYNELFGDRGMTGVAVRAATDKEVQENLKKVIEELREAADRLQGKEDHGTRNAMLLLTGVTLAALFNPATGPATRKWLREQMFGSEDDFTYGGAGGSSATVGDSGSDSAA